MIDPLYLTIVAATAVVALSGIIIGLAYRAAKRSGSRPLRLFGVGFALITVGTLASGSAAAIADFGLTTALLLQAASMTLGLVLLFRSLYADPTQPLTSTPRG